MAEDTTARSASTLPTPQPREYTPVAPEGTEQQATIDELPEARPKLKFSQQPWVQTVVPFATSFLFHAAILLAGFLLIEPISVAYTVIKEQIIIPDAQIIENATPGGIPNPGLGEDPNRAAAQDQIQDVPVAAGLSASQVQTLNQNLLTGGEDGPAVNPLAQMSGKRGIGGEMADVGGGGGEAGGGLAPFGIPGGGAGLAPRSSFMGSGGNAYRLALLCDASGSMLSKEQLLLKKIRETVKALKPTQGFNIIFFTGGEPQALDNRRLVPATPDGKKRAYDFIEQMRTGPQTNPIPAIEMAFAQDVELIYLLTDGDFNFDVNANEQVLAKIRSLNKDGKVKINTIALVGDEDEQASQKRMFVELLKQIADENGGRFDMINVRDVQW